MFLSPRLAVLCLFPAALLAQDASITLAGTVVNSATGEPLPRALVVINGSHIDGAGEAAAGRMLAFQQIHRTVLTDAAGAFRFSGLPEAQYNVAAQKPGFRTDDAGDAQTKNLGLTASQETLKLGLAPLGVITGKVVDQNGEPMLYVLVGILQENIDDGLRRARSTLQVTTDDRGVYRVANLQPGKYYVKILGTPGAFLLPGERVYDIGESFAPGYQNGPTFQSATPIEIGAATQATADFGAKLEPAWRIRGVLHGFTPGEAVTYSLVFAGEEISATPDRFNPQTGAFEFREMVNGPWLLRARQGNRRGEVAVTVKDGDPAPVSLTLDPPMEVGVSVRFTNSPPKDRDGDVPPQPCHVSLTGERLSGAATAQTYGYITGRPTSVVSGTYRVDISCFGAYVESALAGQQDLLSNPVIHIQNGEAPPPIEVLATWGGGALRGKFEKKNIADETRLLLVPQAARSTGPVYTSETAADDDSDFAFTNLAPGPYNLFAFGHDVAWRDPQFLQKLTGGLPVQIEDGKTHEVTVHEVIP